MADELQEGGPKVIAQIEPTKRGRRARIFTDRTLEMAKAAEKRGYKIFYDRKKMMLFTEKKRNAKPKTDQRQTG